MILLALVVSLACETDPAVVSEVPLAPPSVVVNAILVSVPSDCSHLIVDIMMTDQADISVACFDDVTRTYFFHEEQPLYCADEGSHETQLSLQYVDDSLHLSSVP